MVSRLIPKKSNLKTILKVTLLFFSSLLLFPLFLCVLSSPSLSFFLVLFLRISFFCPQVTILRQEFFMDWPGFSLLLFTPDCLLILLTFHSKSFESGNKTLGLHTVCYYVLGVTHYRHPLIQWILKHI